MNEIFGWATAGGLGLLLAGLGVFFWGCQFISGKSWKSRKKE